jgi:hypothetical protein
MTADRVFHAIGRGTFPGLVAAYLGVFMWTFPATYGIDDEANILSLALALSEGTVFLDHAGIDLDADPEWRGHRISKFSPFHAALLVPAMLTDWRAGFLVAPAFVVLGAFILRGMLRQSGLSDAWVALYFLDPGLLYYSRTLLAAVPAAVMGLMAASCLLCDRPRPCAAGASLGVAVLFHIWLAPFAVIFAIAWWISRARANAASLGWLAAGAAPALVLLLAYNLLTTGHPLLNGYWITGHQRAFDGRHAAEFFPFYLASLAIAPIAGWAALTRRWSEGLTIPLATAAVIAFAALYYYRDGAGYGLAGWIPGRRFLLPAALIACVPSARFLAHYSGALGPARTAAVRVTAVIVFVAGFAALASVHQSHLKAQRALQSLVRRAIPDGALVVANAHAFKAFAPVNGRWVLRLVRDEHPPAVHEAPEAYRVWLGLSDAVPSRAWFAPGAAQRFDVASWAWVRTLWVAAPEVPAARGDS